MDQTIFNSGVKCVSIVFQLYRQNEACRQFLIILLLPGDYAGLQGRRPAYAQSFLSNHKGTVCFVLFSLYLALFTHKQRGMYCPSILNLPPHISNKACGVDYKSVLFCHSCETLFLCLSFCCSSICPLIKIQAARSRRKLFSLSFPLSSIRAKNRNGFSFHMWFPKNKFTKWTSLLLNGKRQQLGALIPVSENNLICDYISHWEWSNLDTKILLITP